MIDYTNKRLGIELKAQLERGFNISRLSKWAYGLFYDHRRELNPNLKNILKDLSRMEDDPQFEYSEQELRLLAELLIKETNDPIKQIDELKSKNFGQNWDQNRDKKWGLNK